MKNILIATLITFINLNVFAYDSGKHRQNILSAELDSFTGHIPETMSIFEGRADVNLTKMKVTITLFPNYSCPMGQHCITVMPKPKVIELPLESSGSDNCGNEIYTAQKDQTPVDGLLQIIEVIDHTGNICPHLIILPATSVEYRTLNPWTNTWRSSQFTGSKLQLLPSFL